jgi:hypothetical protein
VCPIFNPHLNFACITLILLIDGYGDWRGDGCSLIENTTEYAVCGCDHLTTFALLLDVSPVEVENPPGYDEFITTLSYLGCLTSILCLLVIILTYSIERQLRKTTNGQLLLNLSLAFLGLYLSFFPATYATPVPALCVISGVIFHYFFLASFIAMGAEATVLYLELVKVFTQRNESLIIRIVIVTWITPLFIAGFTVAPDYRTYTNNPNNFCSPTDFQFWFGYAAPLVIIFGYNFIMFLIIIISIFKQQFKIKSYTGNKSLETSYKNKVLTLITLTFLFGLNWGIGLASTRSLSVQFLRFIFQILFVVSASFHGLFLFILYGVRLPKVRRIWLKWFYILTNQRDKAAHIETSLKTFASFRKGRFTINRNSGKKKSKDDNVELKKITSSLDNNGSYETGVITSDTVEKCISLLSPTTTHAGNGNIDNISVAVPSEMVENGGPDHPDHSTSNNMSDHMVNGVEVHATFQDRSIASNTLEASHPIPDIASNGDTLQTETTIETSSNDDVTVTESPSHTESLDHAVHQPSHPKLQQTYSTYSDLQAEFV